MYGNVFPFHGSLSNYFVVIVLVVLVVECWRRGWMCPCRRSYLCYYITMCLQEVDTETGAEKCPLSGSCNELLLIYSPPLLPPVSVICGGGVTIEVAAYETP